MLLVYTNKHNLKRFNTLIYTKKATFRCIAKKTD